MGVEGAAVAAAWSSGRRGLLRHDMAAERGWEVGESLLDVEDEALDELPFGERKDVGRVGESDEWDACELLAAFSTR